MYFIKDIFQVDVNQIQKLCAYQITLFPFVYRQQMNMMLCCDLKSFRHREVCKKSPEDITAFYNSEGVVKFSKKIVTPTHLCR